MAISWFQPDSYPLKLTKEWTDSSVDVSTGPLSMRFDTGDLFEDIISYEEWLEDALKSDQQVIDAMESIGLKVLEESQVDLYCPCRPTGSYRTCHASAIRFAVVLALRTYEEGLKPTRR